MLRQWFLIKENLLAHGVSEDKICWLGEGEKHAVG
jgi:hypothetical protein